MSISSPTHFQNVPAAQDSKSEQGCHSYFPTQRIVSSTKRLRVYSISALVTLSTLTDRECERFILTIWLHMP